MAIYLEQSTRKDARLLELWRLLDDQDDFNFQATMTADEQDVKEMISDNLFLTFDESGQPIGFIGFYTYYDRKRRYGVRIYIIPEQRRRGYGPQLVEMLRLLAIEKHYSQIFAVVCKDNSRSSRLFERDSNWRLDHQTDRKTYFSCRP